MENNLVILFIIIAIAITVIATTLILRKKEGYTATSSVHGVTLVDSSNKLVKPISMGYDNTTSTLYGTNAVFDDIKSNSGGATTVATIINYIGSQSLINNGWTAVNFADSTAITPTYEYRHSNAPAVTKDANTINWNIIKNTSGKDQLWYVNFRARVNSSNSTTEQIQAFLQVRPDNSSSLTTTFDGRKGLVTVNAPSAYVNPPGLLTSDIIRIPKDYYLTIHMYANGSGPAIGGAGGTQLTIVVMGSF